MLDVNLENTLGLILSLMVDEKSLGEHVHLQRLDENHIVEADTHNQ